MASAADIEQMNKVRMSLGMAPLPVPGGGPQFKDDGDSESDAEDSDDLSTLDKRAAAAGKNWEKHEAERREKEERQKRKDAMKKARDQAARFTKLEGKGLGEADEEEVDTRTWLLQQKKRQKKIDKARKLEEELAAREQQAEYTAQDLAGVKVGHEAAEFDEFTGEQVLTLKDQEIGDESEDDELENSDMKAKEKLEERLRLLKKRPDYDPTEQDGTQNLLSKYDEEIDGKQHKRFTLDGRGNTTEAQRKTVEDAQNTNKGVKISLDMLKDDVPVSDYVDPSTIKVKKAKKSKKEKKTRQKAVDEDDIPAVQRQNLDEDSMDLEGTQASSTITATRKRAFDFDDDDDLQAKLAATRREALKKRKKTDATEIARQLREEMPIDEADPEEGGLVIDETSEFVANLKRPDEIEENSPRRAPASHVSNSNAQQDDDGDIAMGQESYADIEEAQERAERANVEASKPESRTATGLEEEDNMSGQGIGASLAMLRKRGLLDNSESDQKADKERKRAQFLADKEHVIREFDHKAKEQREADRRSGKYDKLSNRDRDALARQQNEQREQFISRLLADKFNKEYKPDVKLQYHDEFGREMNQKEAFKHLSHAFHGKGSGKQKTEKKLKKMEDEKKNVSKNILNIGDEAGFSNVGQAQGKRQKTAGVRLQ